MAEWILIIKGLTELTALVAEMAKNSEGPPTKADIEKIKTRKQSLENEWLSLEP